MSDSIEVRVRFKVTKTYVQTFVVDVEEAEEEDSETTYEDAEEA